MKSSKKTLWSTGLAMFAMFFGAGNIVFPMALGQLTLDKNMYAVLGMIITAIFVPLMGLLAMMLFEGDYRSFFNRMGKLPGFLVTLLILGLIGPFGGIPRCITISFSTLNAFGIENMPGANLVSFSLLNCFLIFLFTFRPTKILSLIAYVLTPVLLLSLAVIVIKGAFVMPVADAAVFTRWETFSKGLIGGYNTMDLLAAFFFASVVLVCLRRDEKQKVPLRENKRLFSIAIMGSLIAATLLGIVYVGFTSLSAGYSASLVDVANHQMLGTLAHKVLGPYAGLVAGVAVSFACLTTEIALTAVFAEFLRKTILKNKVSYEVALIITLLTAFFISTLHFEGISAFLVPILEVCYPALIVLTVLNILHKIFDFKPVKSLVFGTFCASLLIYLI